MKLLLDTHVWVWSRLEPERLSERAREFLEDPENELWLSPVSVWETLVLIERGRIVVDAPATDWVARALERVPMREAPLTHEVAIGSRKIRLEQQDPADRFLAATAIAYGLTLLTADRVLLELAEVSTIAAA